jgi:Fic/DOC family
MVTRFRPSRRAVLDALERAKETLADVGGLPSAEEAEGIWEGIWHEDTHHSTAIEGNTMALRQVRILLEEGLAVGNKELREYLEIQAYSQAAKWVYGQALRSDEWRPRESVTLTEMREIHRLVMEPVWRILPPSNLPPEERPGSFRTADIEPLASGHKPPAWPDVPALISDWLEFVNAGPGSTLLVEHCADAHARLERIHPFRDGNGRTGRLVLNLLLVRHGYPPAIIYKSARARYIRALARADRGDVGPLTELLARSVTQSINKFVLPGLAGSHRMVPLAALATKKLSALALRRAAERGRLRAIRKTDQWYSTKKWVEEYSTSRRRGPRPRTDQPADQVRSTSDRV